MYINMRRSPDFAIVNNVNKSIRERDQREITLVAPLDLLIFREAFRIQRSCEFEGSLVRRASLFVSRDLIGSRRSPRKTTLLFPRGRKARARSTESRSAFRAIQALHDLVEIMQRRGIERTCGISNGRRSEFRVHLCSSVSLCRSGPPSNIRILMTC